jgi:hypothetical protein
MREHSLSLDCSDNSNRNLSFEYDSDDKKHLQVKAFKLYDQQPDVLVTVMLDEESAEAALMFIQSFLLNLSRAKRKEKYGDLV